MSSTEDVFRKRFNIVRDTLEEVSKSSKSEVFRFDGVDNFVVISDDLDSKYGGVFVFSNTQTKMHYYAYLEFDVNVELEVTNLQDAILEIGHDCTAFYDAVEFEPLPVRDWLKKLIEEVKNLTNYS